MPTNIYTYWDSSEHASPHQAEMIRLWERSWRARGWNPRILTIRNAQKSKLFKHSHNNPEILKWAALDSVKGVWFAEPEHINFSFKPPRKTKAKLNPVRFPSQGWEEADVVDFENCVPELVLNCGRKI